MKAAEPKGSDAMKEDGVVAASALDAGADGDGRGGVGVGQCGGDGDGDEHCGGAESSVSIVIEQCAEEEDLLATMSEDELDATEQQVELVSTPEQVNNEILIAANSPEIKLKNVLDRVNNRRLEFAKLLEEHAEIVHKVNNSSSKVTVS